jgi:hypothetical protein
MYGENSDLGKENNRLPRPSTSLGARNDRHEARYENPASKRFAFDDLTPTLSSRRGGIVSSPRGEDQGGVNR